MIKKPIIYCFAILGLNLSCFGNELNLPDPLVMNDGTKVSTAEQWTKQRRPEVLELFRKHVYGRRPIERPESLRFETLSVNQEALAGKAVYKQIEINFNGGNDKKEGKITAHVFSPKGKAEAAPGYLLICHRGIENIDPTRQVKKPFWPVELIIERGYAAIAFHVSDVDPDKHDGFKNGVHGIFKETDERKPDAWATISAWGWGASRILDYLETDKDIDETRITVVGHSRGGKAALWCAAEDERFTMAVSNNSGCTGAALARRKTGESVRAINKRFRHWFCDNYNAFNDKEEELPIDQHTLLALMASRLVYVSSASNDRLADPEGEFLACLHAGPVFELLGQKGVGATEIPQTQKPLHTGHIGYHLRKGKHDLTVYDWKCFMDFSDKHLMK